MNESTSFDLYLGPWLTARVPRMAGYRQQLTGFRDWVLTEVDAQANYTDRYAPPALETYDRSGEVVNRIVANRWYEEQHQELYRRGIIGLPYAESAPHLLTFTMGYLLAQADISLHCPVTLTGAVAYVLGSHAPDAVRQRFLYDVVRMDGQTKTGGTWATEQHGGSDVGATTTVAVASGDHFALHGLKWFTSNANSGLAVATARPEGAAPGSAGLGLVPGAQPSRRWQAEPLSHPQAEGQTGYKRPADRRNRFAGGRSRRDCSSTRGLQAHDGGAGVQPRAQCRWLGRSAAPGTARGASLGGNTSRFRPCAFRLSDGAGRVAAPACAIRSRSTASHSRRPSPSTRRSRTRSAAPGCDWPQRWRNI